jgi:hypothetical protein
MGRKKERKKERKKKKSLHMLLIKHTTIILGTRDKSRRAKVQFTRIKKFFRKR